MSSLKIFREKEMTDINKPKIVFAPGCFDDFEGTQEELDELIAEIHQLVDSGELFNNATPIIEDEFTDEELEALSELLGLDDIDTEIFSDDSYNEHRKLH